MSAVTKTLCLMYPGSEDCRKAVTFRQEEGRMESVILGLREDIQKHMLMEIWLYLLVFAVLLSWLGKQIYSRRSSFS